MYQKHSKAHLLMHILFGYSTNKPMCGFKSYWLILPTFYFNYCLVTKTAILAFTLPKVESTHKTNVYCPVFVLPQSVLVDCSVSANASQQQLLRTKTQATHYICSFVIQNGCRMGPFNCRGYTDRGSRSELHNHWSLRLL